MTEPVQTYPLEGGASSYVNAAKPLEPNVTIVLEKPAHAKLPLGLSKRVSRIDLRVADASRLIEALRRK